MSRTGKTYIAFNIAWKLLQRGFSKKILFLADRVSLRDQAFNEFGPFEGLAVWQPDHGRRLREASTSASIRIVRRR